MNIDIRDAAAVRSLRPLEVATSVVVAHTAAVSPMRARMLSPPCTPLMKHGLEASLPLPVAAGGELVVLGLLLLLLLPLGEPLLLGEALGGETLGATRLYVAVGGEHVVLGLLLLLLLQLGGPQLLG